MHLSHQSDDVSLEFKTHFLDYAGELEWELVSEIHRRAMIHADIEAFAEGELGRDSSFEPTVSDLGAVDQQRDRSAFADAAAVVIKFYGDLRLSFW